MDKIQLITYKSLGESHAIYTKSPFSTLYLLIWAFISRHFLTFDIWYLYIIIKFLNTVKFRIKYE